MIKHIRLTSHQLSQPQFDKPEDLVNWMGAVQAQDYNMAKWALGVRLNNSTLSEVQNALDEGRILRTHILRPTWHFISAEDIRWMLQLSGKRIRTAFQSYGKSKGFIYDNYIKSCFLLEKILRDCSLTKQEVYEELIKSGFNADVDHMSCLLTVAETEGIICSGIDKNKKPTYALLEQRVAPAKELSKEEALALLAKKYFQSHSPASLNDFVWWSGLSITEAKKGIEAIKSELITDTFNGNEFYVHNLYQDIEPTKDILHFLPSCDEYLISYKSRTDVLDKEHYSKAFNNYGIFQPVILYNGKVVGNWKKAIKKSQPEIDISVFDIKTKLNKKLISQAEKRYKEFLRLP